jgi:hypothetical protein
MSNTHNTSVKEDWKEQFDKVKLRFAVNTKWRIDAVNEAKEWLESNVISPLLEENEVLKRRVRDLEAGAIGSDLAPVATLGSKPGILLDRCTLPDDELLNKCRSWITDLCRTGGKAWMLQVPVNYNEDPDMLFSELVRRYKQLLNSNSIPKRSVATEDASSNDAEAHHHLQLIHQEVIREKEELNKELDNLKNNQ